MMIDYTKPLAPQHEVRAVALHVANREQTKGIPLHLLVGPEVHLDFFFLLKLSHDDTTCQFILVYNKRTSDLPRTDCTVS